jgi:para-nitrobenzyl esterase
MNDVVSTLHGRVRGGGADGIHTFKGIPYAAPPFGANRLRPPRPLEAWSGVRDALTYGPTPPQLTLPPPFDVIAPSVPGEGCLNLNIWSSDLGSAGQPVMVWIPGGAFEAGGAVVYDGSRFARDGVVCVSINYRVGADGFLALGDGVANLGLLDQIAALEWVQENIAAFGGDPGNVTIFGESAGASSVGTTVDEWRLFLATTGAIEHVTAEALAAAIARYRTWRPTSPPSSASGWSTSPTPAGPCSSVCRAGRRRHRRSSRRSGPPPLQGRASSSSSGGQPTGAGAWW